MGIFKGTKELANLYLGNQHCSMVYRGNLLVWIYDILIPKFFYWYGDGTKNNQRADSGGGYANASGSIVYKTNTMGGTPVAKTGPTKPYRQGIGNVYYGFVQSLIPSTTFEYSLNLNDTTIGQRTFTLNKDIEHTLLLYGYQDEDEDAGTRGATTLKFDGAWYTLNQCIQNGFIKPMVLISEYCEDGSTGYSLDKILNGQNITTVCYGAELLVQTNIGYNFQGVNVNAWFESGRVVVFPTSVVRYTDNTQVYKKSQYYDSQGKRRRYW